MITVFYDCSIAKYGRSEQLLCELSQQLWQRVSFKFLVTSKFSLIQKKVRTKCFIHMLPRRDHFYMINWYTSHPIFKQCIKLRLCPRSHTEVCDSYLRHCVLRGSWGVCRSVVTIQLMKKKTQPHNSVLAIPLLVSGNLILFLSHQMAL